VFPQKKQKPTQKTSNPAFVPGTFVTATATMPGTRATTDLPRIEGKWYPLLSGNNVYIKNHAGL
jgi:hypothetical protein